MRRTTYDPIVSFKKYEEIVKKLEWMIEDGYLIPGDKLPAERLLSQQLNVSRSTLTQAFRLLESKGIIVVRPGLGRFIRETTSTFDTNSIIGNIQKSAITDLLEVREVVEKKTCELACERASAEDHNYLRKTLDTPLTSISDVSFHIAIAQASQNPIFINLMRSSMDLLHSTREYTLLINRTPDEIYTEHIEILEALLIRNKDKATLAIDKHIKNIRKNIKASF